MYMGVSAISTVFVKLHGRAQFNSLAIAGKISAAHALAVLLVVHSWHLPEANSPPYIRLSSVTHSLPCNVMVRLIVYIGLSLTITWLS